MCSNEYDIYRSDRSDKQGGGVALLIKKNLSSHLVSSSEIDGGEVLWVMVNTNKEKILIGTFYRSNVTKLDPINKLFEDLDAFSSFNCPIVLLGDYNLPNVNWNIPSAPCAWEQDIILEKFLQLGFRQYVDEPTRENNILDLILCNSDNVVQNTSLLDPLSTSDHSMVCFNVSLCVSAVPEREKFRMWKKCFYFGFERELERIQWSEIFKNSRNVDEMYDTFLRIFHTLVENFVPLHTHKNICKPMSKFSRNLLLKRRKILRKFRSSNDARDKAKFNVINTAFTNSLKNDERKREESVLRSPNPKKFFDYVRSKSSSRPKIPALKNAQGNFCFSDTDKANIFSDMFSSYFSVDNGQAPVFTRPREGSSMPHISITRKMVYDVLKTFPNKLSGGPDEIPSLALRKFASQLSVPFELIFNYCLENGVIPEIWRQANVVPLYKGKGKVDDAVNYRPISQTSNVCKAMEKIVKAEVLKFLEATSAITKNQFGFLQHRSTLTQLLECLNLWTSSINAGVPVDVIYLDVSKAFDTVSHEKLIKKLDFYGIRSNWLTWIKAYLYGRSQRVKVESAISDMSPVTSGVPQGSVLGPILFILYINDLVSVLQKSQIKLYADDAKIFFRVGSDADFRALERDVNAVYEWMQNAQLSLALHKCEVLHLGFNNPSNIFNIGGNNFQMTKVVKDLGIYISDDLKVFTHISKIVASAYSRISCFLRTFLCRERVFMSKIYCTYIRPLLEYNTPAWSPFLRKDIFKIESVQRYFTRKVPGMAEMSYQERLIEMGIETLEVRRLKFDLMMAYKILNGLVDLDYNDFFTICRGSVTRGHGMKLLVPKARLDVRKHFFAVRVVKVWNGLSNDVITAPSLSRFKSKLDTCDFSEYLITV